MHHAAAMSASSPVHVVTFTDGNGSHAARRSVPHASAPAAGQAPPPPRLRFSRRPVLARTVSRALRFARIRVPAAMLAGQPMGVGHDGGSGMTLAGDRASVVVIGGGLAGNQLRPSGWRTRALRSRCSRPGHGSAARRGRSPGAASPSTMASTSSCAAAWPTGTCWPGSAWTSSCPIQDRLDLTVLGPDAQARVRRSGLPAPLASGPVAGRIPPAVAARAGEGRDRRAGAAVRRRRAAR